MINRIKDSLCHPSRVGLYHNDKGYIVFIHLFIMIVLMTVVAFISGINSSYFTKEDSNTIYNLVINNDNDYNLSFTNKTLNGDSYMVKSNIFDASFLNDDLELKNDDKMTMSFNKEDVDIYLGNVLLNKYSYQRSSFNDFSFKSLKEGSLEARYEFTTLIMGALMSVNKTYVNINITSGVLSFILSYIFLVLIVLAFSYMSKPDLGFSIRLKICIYSTLIYFLLIIFKICFNIKLFEYLAYIIPVFYSSSAFRRIVRVRIRKN